MKTYFDCIPCLIRQSLGAVRLVTDDQRVHEQILREALEATSRMDLQRPPAVLAQGVHRRIRELCGDSDPYLACKDQFNQLALSILPDFREHLKHAEDPWKDAVRLAIAGNIMDLAVNSALGEAEAEASIMQAMSEPLAGNAADFATAIAQAESILYLTDNAGEIVFDRLVIEQLPAEKVTVAVRGGPVINDATRHDAEVAGLTDLVRVIDNGSDAPGTLLDDCSPAFRQCFEEADLIVAKGQGNYETLRESPRPIFFLLRVKCPVIARDIGCPVGTMVLRSPDDRNLADLLVEERVSE